MNHRHMTAGALDNRGRLRRGRLVGLALVVVEQRLHVRVGVRRQLADGHRGRHAAVQLLRAS